MSYLKYLRNVIILESISFVLPISIISWTPNKVVNTMFNYSIKTNIEFYKMHFIFSDGLLTARLGSILLEEFDANALEIPVAKAIYHPDYDPYTLTNDIAVLKLAQKAVYSDFIRPACLPEQRESPDSTSTCFSTGFGTISKYSTLSL